MAWAEFVAAWFVFFFTHSVPVRPPVRPALVQRFGARGFLLAYSALSLGVLGWLVNAAGRAPFVPLWGWAPWQNDIPLAVMLIVCVILALSVGRPNPFSFGGAQNDRFDPKRAGIVRLTRHPLLLALALWSGAHVVPNGDLAHVLLFGVFATFAVLGGRLIDARKKREMGAQWDVLNQAVTLRLHNTAPLSWRGASFRVCIGIAIYGVLLAAHPWLFGVSPLGY